ncbi:MAG: hypothetical protein L3J84_07685 [Gammaproteobacteria bacterium]|nr:hypothetical protein [Gammaproteobacteria bacterium]
MEYFKLIIYLVWTYSFFSIFVSLKQGLIERPWVIITCSAIFAVFQAYLFHYFIDPGLIYDFILFLLVSLVIKLVMTIKLAKKLIEMDGENAYGINEDNYDLVMYRLKKTKYISIANIVVFIVTFFISYVIITN